MGPTVPLFAFGLFITLLVGLGVVLAVTEFRAAQRAPSPTEDEAKTASDPGA